MRVLSSGLGLSVGFVVRVGVWRCLGGVRLARPPSVLGAWGSDYPSPTRTSSAGAGCFNDLR